VGLLPLAAGFGGSGVQTTETRRKRAFSPLEQPDATLYEYALLKGDSRGIFS
jgi:hypothetical protein